MHTKYRVSTENTYMGPIAPVADSLLEPLHPNILSRINTSRPIERPNGNDTNNNLKWKSFTTQYYDCWLKTSTKGEIRFYAGHHKHTFTTCDRPITCKLIKGQLKVKCECGSQKWTITEANNTIELSPNSKYYVKNNSLRNECIVSFKLG